MDKLTGDEQYDLGYNTALDDVKSMILKLYL